MSRHPFLCIVVLMMLSCSAAVAQIAADLHGRVLDSTGAQWAMLTLT